MQALDDILLAQLRPRALPGFEASPYGSGSRYLVKDPSLTHFMLTSRVGVKVLELADGERTLADIAAMLGSAAGSSLPLQRLTQFFDESARLRLIDPSTWENAAVAKQKQKSRPFIKIDGILAWLDAHRAWWLNPATRLAAVALLMLGVVQLLFFPAGGGMLAPLHMLTFTPMDVVLLALPLFFVCEIVLHEFAHALACHVHGARTRGFAFQMVWRVVPAIVTDTLDAHGIANKYHRMFVSFAGPMVNIAAYGVVMSLYRMLDPASFGAHLLLAYSGLSLSMIVLTLNPFLISMDGYWIVADYLEQPNLRKIAQGHLLNSLARLPGLGRWRKPAAAIHGARAFAYSVYAAVAFSWTGVLIVRLIYELGQVWHAMHHSSIGA
jgi:putative peptide zinc metalloprotease protein